MQVHLVINENGLEEWMMLELQGTIEGTEIEGQLVGNFAWRKDNSEAVFLIGHHLLEGKLITLDKPFLVTRPCDNISERKMIVEGVVTRRIVFKSRPKPIVAKE